MSKSLYSLILSDEVISRIDRMAVRENTNRSALVNQILAEYCSLVTPEKRIESVFDSVERLFGADSELAAFTTPNQPTMFFKTSLEYRYRPTVRYDLRLYPQIGDDGALGELTVTFRTQSAELLDRIDQFFRLWIASETESAPDDPPQYALAPGRMTRSIHQKDGTDGELTAEELAEAISDYIRLLDTDMKAFIAGKITPDSVEYDCRKRMRDGDIV